MEQKAFGIALKPTKTGKVIIRFQTKKQREEFLILLNRSFTTSEIELIEMCKEVQVDEKRKTSK
jgi:hypothetical protein